VGCGIGRNLRHLDGVGVDHNQESVELARHRGCTAHTPDAFLASADAQPGSFDSLLFAQVVEHMTHGEAVDLLGAYVGFLRPAGRVVLIAPQEAGYRSDDTHVEFMDFAGLGRILSAHGMATERAYSFPFPRAVGRFFPHNEFVVVGRSPDAS